MARKPNKRERELRRWRDAREARTAVPDELEAAERRPLVGLGDHYEITRSGHVWSLRLGRFIKHQYDPISNRTYISVTINGVRSTRGIWRSVVDSWLSPDEQAVILRELPVDAHGHDDQLRLHQGKIAALAKDLHMPTDAVFTLFLGASTRSGGDNPPKPEIDHTG